MDLEDITQSANSELRFLTLELMKLANKRGISFEEIAKEYVKNTTYVQKLIDSTDASVQKSVEPESNSD